MASLVNMRATEGTNAYQYSPLPLPPTANPKYFEQLGREVKGFDPGNVSAKQMEELVDQLYRVGLWLVGTMEAE